MMISSRRFWVGLSSKLLFIACLIVAREAGGTCHGGGGGDDIATYFPGRVVVVDLNWHAGSGDDLLIANAGSDYLSGGTGDDTIFGKWGDDILVGGLGRDRFVFESDPGHDVIPDFEPYVDTIDVASLLEGVVSSDLFADDFLRSFQQDGDTLTQFRTDPNGRFETFLTLEGFTGSLESESGNPFLIGVPGQPGITVESNIRLDADSPVYDSVHIRGPAGTVADIVEGAAVGYELLVYDSSAVNIVGASVGYEVETFGSTIVQMSDAQIGYELEAHDSSTVSISGGLVCYAVEAYDSTTLNLYGGTFGLYLQVNGESLANFYGGSTGQLQVKDSGTVNVFGTDLELANGRLIGTLADGTSLNLPYVLSGGGQIVLHIVPEPDVGCIIFLGVLCVVVPFRTRGSRLDAASSRP